MRWRRARGARGGPGEGPPATARSSVSTSSWPVGRTDSVGWVRFSWSLSTTIVFSGIWSRRSASKYPSGGATTGEPPRPCTAMLRSESSSARRRRLGPLRASAATSGSAYPRTRVVFLRRVVRNDSSTASARARCSSSGTPVTGAGLGEGAGLLSGALSSPSSDRGVSEPRESGGLPRPKSRSASRTAGSSSQVTGAAPAEAAKSANRARRPSGVGEVRPSGRGRSGCRRRRDGRGRAAGVRRRGAPCAGGPRCSARGG